MTDSPRRPPARLMLVLVLAFTAGVSLWCIIEYRSCPLFNVPISDEASYLSWAERVAGGDLIGHEVFYQDPLYPYLLALILALFGKNLLLIRVLQAAMGTASVYLVYWTGRRLMSESAALLGAALVACYCGLYFFELLILKTSLEVLLAAASIALGVWAAERPGWARMAAVGAGLGVLALLRGNVLMIAPLAAVWAYLVPPAAPVRARLARAGALIAAFTLMLAPASLRNYEVSGEFVLTTSQGGSNFYIGNNPRADGGYTALENIRSSPRFQAEDFREAACRRTGQAMTGSQASRYWFGQAWEWMRDHPADAAVLELRKIFLLVNHYEVPDNQSFYLVRREFVPALHLAFINFGWFCGPALAGMIMLVRRQPKAIFPAGFALAYAASLIVFYVVARYRLPMLPAMAPFAGYFLEAIMSHLRRRRLGPMLAPAALAAALLVVGLWPRSEPPNVRGYALRLLGDAYLRTDRPGEALRTYDRALVLLPGVDEVIEMWRRAVAAAGPEDVPLLLASAGHADMDPGALMAIGVRLEELHRPLEAITIYEKAIARAPDFFPALPRLAWLYAATPGSIDPDRAARDLTRAALLRPDYRSRQEYTDTARAIAAAYLAAGDTTNARKWGAPD